MPPYLVLTSYLSPSIALAVGWGPRYGPDDRGTRRQLDHLQLTQPNTMLTRVPGLGRIAVSIPNLNGNRIIPIGQPNRVKGSAAA